MRPTILEAVIVAVWGGDEFVMSRIDMPRVVARVQAYVAGLPRFFAVIFRVVLFLIEYSMPPLAWKFRRFSRMPIERRVEYLDSWARSPLALKRNLFRWVKMTCVAMTLAEHRLLTDIGYGDALARRLGHAADPVVMQ